MPIAEVYHRCFHGYGNYVVVVAVVVVAVVEFVTATRGWRAG